MSNKIKYWFPRSLLYLLILLIGACGSGSDSNSSQQTATTPCSTIADIAIEDSVNNITISEDSSKCYSFNANSGKSYTISLSTNSGDADIAIFLDSSFAEASIIDFSINEGTATEIIIFVAPTTSTYFIEVYGYLASNYSLFISENTPPPEVDLNPIANVNWLNPAPISSSVVLDASGSYDPEGNNLSYNWTLVDRPTGSNATLANNNQSTTSFTADVIGNYQFTLTVNDGTQDSVLYTGVVFVTNNKPVASIQSQISGAIGQPILLNGRNSTDADGHTLVHEWLLLSKPDNSSLIFPAQSGDLVSFNADVFGDYTFQLVVDDSFEQSDPVITTVSVKHKFTGLNFRITDAEFSDTIGRAVLVSADSSSLLTYDITDSTVTELSLPLPPTAVSVSPDGLFAAVGHNGWISYVDLSANSLIKSFPVTTDVLDIVLDGNGYVHAFPRIDQWERIRSINIATEVETLHTGNFIRAGTLARLHPNGTAIYGADNGLSPSDIEKYDISGGSTVYLYDSPYHGDYSMCGNLWIAEDGLRLFTRCGNVFRSSADQAQDMTYNGALQNISGQIVNLSHSGEAGMVAVIEGGNSFSDPDGLMDRKIRFFNYDFLTDAGFDLLPDFTVGDNTFAAHGKFVFYNSDGTQYLAIVQADSTSGLLNDFGISVQ